MRAQVAPPQLFNDLFMRKVYKYTYFRGRIDFSPWIQ